MRISTANIFDLGSASITRNQAELLATQQKLASGRRTLSPADDPVASSEALRVRQASALNEQYAGNQRAAQTVLQQADSVLGDVSTLLTDVRVLAVAAGNAGLQYSDRQSMAQELSGQLAQLISLANSNDGTGRYLFGGYSDGAAPFSQSVAGVAYNGDQGSRALQVTDTRAMAVSDSGAEVFQHIPRGNGVFRTAPGAGNSGTGVIDAGQVTNGTLLTGHDYQIRFAGTGSATTYSVIDTTAGTAVAGPATYTSGSVIAFEGMQVAISGQPEAGDVFDISPAAAQSVFETIQGLIDALKAPASSAAGRTALANALGDSTRNIDNALDHVLSIRTGVGSRMRELGSLQDSSSNRGIQIEQALSQLEDLDYAQAATKLSQQQLALEAAQKSFVQISSLSLFKYL